MNLGPQTISSTYQFVLNASGGRVTLGDDTNPNWIGTTVASTTGTQTISGVKTFNNNTVFSGSIGVGTSSPTCPLDIESAGIRINTSRYISSNSDSAGIALFGGTAGNGANIELYGGSHVGSPNGAYFDADNMYFRSANASSERMRITSAGNVGIGTDSPAVALQVNKATDPSVRVFENGSSVDTRITSLVTAGIIGTYSNHPTIFYANAAERMRITSAGNVGIGTTPTARLDVVGPTLTLGTPSTYAMWISNGGGGSNGDLAFASNSTNAYIQSWASKPLIINSQGNNVGIHNATPTTALDVSGTTTTNTLILGTQTNKATISYATNTARTFTLPSVTADSTFAFINQAQTFTSNQVINADLRVQGDLDFGSSTLAGTAHSSLFKTNGGTLGNTAGNTINLASIGFGATEGTSLSFIARRQSAGSSASSSAIGLSYNTGDITGINSQQIWMVANGRVGVGTNAPTEKLEIQGNLKVNGSITGNSIGLSNAQSALAANVTMTAINTWTAGPSVSLTSGTWLVNAHATFQTIPNNISPTYSARIADSAGTTNYASSSLFIPINVPQATASITLTSIVTLTTTTSIRLDGASNAGTTNIMRFQSVSPTVNNATQITAVRIG